MAAIITCKQCFDVKPHAAHGLCITCYRGSRKKGRPPNRIWNAGRIAEVRDLIANGFSCSEIGRQLGCTKNSIIGVCSRNWITAKELPITTTADRLKAWSDHLDEVMAITVERLPQTAREKKWLRSLERMG